MPREVRHQVAADQAFPLVRLAGTLDRETAGEARATLLDVLAGRSEAVVVDVADLMTAADGVGVLRDLHRESEDWPAARLALCDPGDAERWSGSGWPVWPDAAQAFGSFGPPEQARRLALELDPVVGAARRSRELITETCALWDWDEIAGSACIVVTELVNNVVAHARTTMTLLLAVRGNGLSVAVRDRSPVVPSFTGAPAPTAYGGRGMLLIDSVATRWGNLVVPGGKVVWALLAGDADGHGQVDAVHQAAQN